MATGRVLRGWTDGRARQAQAASGELWTRIVGSRGGGAWLTTTDGRAPGPGTSKAGQPTVQIEPKSRIGCVGEIPDKKRPRDKRPLTARTPDYELA